MYSQFVYYRLGVKSVWAKVPREVAGFTNLVSRNLCLYLVILHILVKLR